MTVLKSFSLIIPAYNEELRLPKTLEKVISWSKKIDFKLEILIMDDGSKDKTAQIVKNFSKKDKRIKLISSKNNLGKMLQVIRGFKTAKNEIVGVMDADSAADPQEFSNLLPKLNSFDIVMGSRYLRGNLSPITGKPLVARILSKGFTSLFRFFFVVPVFDPQIGFKIYKKKVLEKILPLVNRSDGFADTEIIIKAFGLGFKISEIPIRYHHVSEHSRINRIKAIIPSIIAIISCWHDSYQMYKQGKLKKLPIRGKFIAEIIRN